MSGYGLWFSRFTAGGEALLPLVAFGSSAWMFLDAATLPDAAKATVAPTTAAAPQAERDDSGLKPAQPVGLAAR